MVAIYARQSLYKKDSISIETQIEHCKRELAQGEEHREYIDRGYSGKNTSRPDFIRMMEDIRAGGIDKVIVYKIDRISRSTIDFHNMKKVFDEHGVEFVSSTESIDSKTPMGRAMLGMSVIFAQMEREQIQERVRDSYHASSERGSYGGKAPFGYIKTVTYIDGKKTPTLTANPDTGGILKEIFQLYANTAYSLGYIAKKLNSRGIPSPEGKAWDGSKLSRIIPNPIYVKADADIYDYYNSKGVNITNDIGDFEGVRGCVTYGAWDRQLRKFSQPDKLTLSVGLHEGLIDSATFLKCLYKLTDNTQVMNTGRGNFTWLTGLVKCGKCGYAMKVSRQKKGRPKFRCSGSLNYGVCDAEAVNIADVEDAVMLEIIDHAKRHRDMKAKRLNTEDTEINRLKIEISRIEQQIDKIVDAIAAGNEVITARLNDRVASLEDEKNKLIAAMLKRKSKSKAERDVKQFFDIAAMWEGMTLEQKKETALMLIKRVEIINDSIQIKWKYNL